MMVLAGVALATGGGLIIYGLCYQLYTWWDRRQWQRDVACAERRLEEAEEERQVVRWTQTLGRYADTALEIHRLPEAEPRRTIAP